MKPTIRRWVGECLRKKKMSEEIANAVVKRAAKEGAFLRAYYCPHCTRFHVTKQPEAPR